MDVGDLTDYVGQPPFTSDRIYGRTPAGVVMGLAWTSMGGNALYIEAAMVESGDGKGGIRTTGVWAYCQVSTWWPLRIEQPLQRAAAPHVHAGPGFP